MEENSGIAASETNREAARRKNLCSQYKASRCRRGFWYVNEPKELSTCEEHKHICN